MCKSREIGNGKGGIMDTTKKTAKYLNVKILANVTE